MAHDSTQRIKIGIIGGSGIYKMNRLSEMEERVVDTPFGKPSDAFLTGKLNGVRVAFLPRHGREHLYLPSEINYRANIFGFKALGVSKIIAVTAVGSLVEGRPPLDMVVPDQLIDATRQRPSTFFGQGIAAHIPFATPFCPTLSQLLYDTAAAVNDGVHQGGTLVTIEGPAFSTKAESNLYRKWGCQIIGMTTYQEAKLSREAGICYAALAMITDYDCWRDTPLDEVNVETVVANLDKNSANAQSIITNLLPILSGQRECLCGESLEGAIMTVPEAVRPEVKDKLALLIQHHIAGMTIKGPRLSIKGPRRAKENLEAAEEDSSMAAEHPEAVEADLEMVEAEPLKSEDGSEKTEENLEVSEEDSKPAEEKPEQMEEDSEVMEKGSKMSEKQNDEVESMPMEEMDDWSRRNSFEFFKDYEHPLFNTCANVTITNTYHVLEESGIPKFNAMLWLICNAANQVPEIRCRLRGNRVVEYPSVHPSFTWMNEDNSLTFCLAEYTQDVGVFFSNVQQSIDGVNPNPVIADQQTVDNVLYISCVPWINFTSISHPVKMDDTCAIPRISWGKFTQIGEHWTMPLSIQLHHGLADGYHVGCFFKHLQQLLDHPEKIAWPVSSAPTGDNRV